jgi:predicted amidohydrolase YtcJ
MRTLETAVRQANTLGITSVQTDDLEGAPLSVLLEACSRLEQEGKLTIRIFEEVQAARRAVLEDFLKRNMRTGWGSDLFQIGNIKLLTDGSLGARTAYLRRDYSDAPGNCGIAVYNQEELDELVLTAHQADMQIAFHAIGDGAIEQCLDALEKALSVSKKNLRHRLVHCQIADENLLERIRKLEIGADIQPPFTASDWSLTEPRLGKARADGSYNWRTMLRKGIPLGGGSDSPVEPLDPLWGIYCAVTRQDFSGLPEGGWHPQERLTVDEAVALYTSGAAYMSLEERRKGTIEPGKLADFVVLSRDIFSLAPEEILKTRVVMTVIGGRICYRM